MSRKPGTIRSTPRDRRSERGRSERLERERESLEERTEALRFEFVLSELDLAITFCRIAESTNSASHARRNLALGELAYDTARHFLRSSRLSGAMRRAAQERVAKVESVIRGLHDADEAERKGSGERALNQSP